MTKFVVAGTFEQYRNHIKKMSYNPNEYVYVSDVCVSDYDYDYGYDHDIF